MASEAVNVNPHYRSDARHPEAASSDFVAVCYFLALVVPAVGFWLGLALVFRRREMHGAVVMVIAFFTAILWTLIFYTALVADLRDASLTFD